MSEEQNNAAGPELQPSDQGRGVDVRPNVSIVATTPAPAAPLTRETLQYMRSQADDEVWQLTTDMALASLDQADDVTVGRSWKEDSSLEKWFPYTAERIAALERENAQAKEAIEALSAGKPLGDIVGIHTAQNALRRVEELEAQLSKLQESTFHPDWSMLEATRESLREHQQMMRELREQIAGREGWQWVPKECTEHQYEAAKVFAETMVEAVGKLDLNLIYACFLQAAPKPPAPAQRTISERELREIAGQHAQEFTREWEFMLTGMRALAERLGVKVTP